MRMTKRALSIVLAAMMIMSMLVVGAVSASAAGAAAKIGDTTYETLTAALNAANDGDTVTVLADCEGDGWVAPQGKFPTGLTVDFNNHTYKVSGKPVGSAGTESIAFQLLKNNKITFTNGTITADCTVNPREGKYLQRMIQNYSDLTLDGMTVSMVGAYYDQITVSTCNGSTVIKDSTVNAPDFSRYGIESSAVRGAALTVGTFSSYPSVGVTVKGNSVINGDINVDPSGANAENFSLNLESGTINGGVNLNETAEAAVEATPEKITTSDEFTKHVAKIGDNYYESLEAAFAAAVDGDKITVLADCAGNGIKVARNKFTAGLTVDFGGHTYTMDGEEVGSPGTRTQAFQLLMNNNITFKNGTLYSEKALFLVQNYSNLTLDRMTLTLNNPSYHYGYTLSNNNGNTVIKDTTINANPAGIFAFDVCRGGGSNSYPSVNVTVKGNSVINGDVEIDAKYGDAKEGFSLTLESGTLNGDIKLTEGAETAIEETPAKANVTKADAFNQEAPAGYDWVDNGDGTSSLVPYILTGKAEIEGFQRKFVKTAESEEPDGNDINTKGVRIITKVDQNWLDENASEYGYVVAKYTGDKEQADLNFANLTKDGGNGQKTIDCTGTVNQNITGISDSTDDYVTLAVNGMDNGDKIVARFYVVVGGVTYYANYVNVVEYNGILATY